MTGDTSVTICNAALIALGEDLIVALTDQTKRAYLCNARYDAVRRDVLRRRPWSCAKAQAQIAASVTGPSFGYANAFALPTDFLRLWDVEGDNDATTSDYPWELVGAFIQTDDDGPINLNYVSDLQNTAQMDSLLVQCISLALAADICVALTQSQDKREKLLMELEQKLSEGALVTSQENSPKEWDEDVWLRSRNA